MEEQTEHKQHKNVQNRKKIKKRMETGTISEDNSITEENLQMIKEDENGTLQENDTSPKKKLKDISEVDENINVTLLSELPTEEEEEPASQQAGYSEINETQEKKEQEQKQPNGPKKISKANTQKKKSVQEKTIQVDTNNNAKKSFKKPTSLKKDNSVSSEKKKSIPIGTPKPTEVKQGVLQKKNNSVLSNRQIVYKRPSPEVLENKKRKFTQVLTQLAKPEYQRNMRASVFPIGVKMTVLVLRTMRVFRKEMGGDPQIIITCVVANIERILLPRAYQIKSAVSTEKRFKELLTEEQAADQVDLESAVGPRTCIKEFNIVSGSCSRYPTNISPGEFAELQAFHESVVINKQNANIYDNIGEIKACGGKANFPGIYKGLLSAGLICKPMPLQTRKSLEEECMYYALRFPREQQEKKVKYHGNRNGFFLFCEPLSIDPATKKAAVTLMSASEQLQKSQYDDDRMNSEFAPDLQQQTIWNLEEKNKNSWFRTKTTANKVPPNTELCDMRIVILQDWLYEGSRKIQASLNASNFVIETCTGIKDVAYFIGIRSVIASFGMIVYCKINSQETVQCSSNWIEEDQEVEQVSSMEYGNIKMHAEDEIPFNLVCSIEYMILDIERNLLKSGVRINKKMAKHIAMMHTHDDQEAEKSSSSTHADIAKNTYTFFNDQNCGNLNNYSQFYAVWGTGANPFPKDFAEKYKLQDIQKGSEFVKVLLDKYFSNNKENESEVHEEEAVQGTQPQEEDEEQDENKSGKKEKQKKQAKKNDPKQTMLDDFLKDGFSVRNGSWLFSIGITASGVANASSSSSSSENGKTVVSTAATDRIISSFFKRSKPLEINNRLENKKNNISEQVHDPTTKKRKLNSDEISSVQYAKKPLKFCAKSKN